MKRRGAFLLVLLVIAVAVWWRGRPVAAPVVAVAPRAEVSSPPPTTVPAPPPVGTRLLEGYGDPARPPERDLAAIALVMENFLLLNKGAAQRPLSANEEWAAALCGLDGRSERFLQDDDPALNQRGQLVDRWGTPLFFHAVGAGRWEVRSAGSDRAMWTADDLQRNSDGTLVRGSDAGR